MEDYFEPAIHILHNDGNPSLLLKYVSHETKAVSQGVNETIITLGDDKYPVTVKLHYVTYPAEDIIKTYTEISHKEKKPVVLHQYASSMLHLNRAKYYLTEFRATGLTKLISPTSRWSLVKSARYQTGRPCQHVYPSVLPAFFGPAGYGELW